MVLTPDEITIAVTVFDRRRYLRQAITSALLQTIPVRVMVVEDCGPDHTLQDLVRSEFGSRVDYLRTSKRRGLFGILNSCVELCPTRWLSILHDDDYLSPQFVEAMLALQRQYPGNGLYFGGTTVLNELGQPLFEWPLPGRPGECRSVTLHDIKLDTPFAFPGQLFEIEKARAVGGFRETSQYCGDWELWCKLVARDGGACTPATVAFSREHAAWDRATNRVTRAGKEYPLNYVQIKRALHLLRQRGVSEKVDRITYQKRRPIPTRFLLRYGTGLSPRTLAYHRRLLLLSAPPSAGYALFQLAVRICGTRFLYWGSQAWNCLFPAERA